MIQNGFHEWCVQDIYSRIFDHVSDSMSGDIVMELYDEDYNLRKFSGINAIDKIYPRVRKTLVEDFQLKVTGDIIYVAVFLDGFKWGADEMEFEKKDIFLGGTCNGSKWRDEFVKLLNSHVTYFNPVVEDWNEASYDIELKHREKDNFTLYCITPEMEGFYSIAEVVDDSNKRPQNTIFCYLKKYGGKEFSEVEYKSIMRTVMLVANNGGRVFSNLKDCAKYLNRIVEIKHDAENRCHKK